MEITIRLRNGLNGQEKEVMLPASSESIKIRLGLDEYDDDDNLVIIDSNVDFIGENDSLVDVCLFAELVEDVDEHIVYACYEHFGYSVKEFLFYDFNFDDVELLWDIDTHKQLGEYWINRLGFRELSRDQLEMYFDYEAYGRDIAINNDGGFVYDGFLDMN